MSRVEVSDTNTNADNLSVPSANNMTFRMSENGSYTAAALQRTTVAHDENIYAYPEAHSFSTERPRRYNMDENNCYESNVKMAPQNFKVTCCGASKGVCITLLLIMVLVTMLMLAVIASCIAFGLEISNFKAGTDLPTQQMNNVQLNQSIAELQHQAEQISDLQWRMEQIIALLTDLQLGIPATSCAALPSFYPSGYYWVRATNGPALRVYCDMTRSCGNITGGWTRVADLNMTNSSQQCPDSLTLSTSSNLRTCVRSTGSPGCSSVQYPTSNIQYSKVCGRVIGYQIGTPDAFAFRQNDAEVDGVSLSHGVSREHIWTFAAAIDETTPSLSNCQCMTSAGALPPRFIGTDYFCDTALRTVDFSNPPGLISARPLWDGEGCEAPNNNCCSFNTPPWFYKELVQSTTDDIEVQVCRDESVTNEDIAIEIVEIYIQ